jgi:hypothetical protein
VRLPATIRVGLLQANRDPSVGGRLKRVRVQGVEVPGLGGSGRITVSGTSPGGRIIRRTLPGHVTFSIKPQSGGMSVFTLASRRVFGPTRPGTGMLSATRPSARRPGCCCPRSASSCAGGGWRSPWSATTAGSCGHGRWR